VFNINANQSLIPAFQEIEKIWGKPFVVTIQDGTQYKPQAM